MIWLFREESVTELFLAALAQMDERSSSPSPRGKKVRELHTVVMELADPRRRVLFAKKRNNNPFAMMAETLWVLAGRDDIEYLSYWLPRAKDFSDDGRTWRGAYGPRLRNFGDYDCIGSGLYKHHPLSGYGDGGIDQIKKLLDILKKDPDSRRAAFAIYDPSVDMVDSKDVPCSNYGVFLLRDGKLDLTMVMRSNDILWGFSYINAFEWTVLQEIIADQLGVKLGNYTHVVNSLHLYEDYFSKAEEILNANCVATRENLLLPPWKLAEGETSIDQMTTQIQTFIETEFMMRTRFETASEDCMAFIRSHTINNCIKFVEWFELLTAWHIYKNLGYSSFIVYMRTLPKTTLWEACNFYIKDKEASK